MPRDKRSSFHKTLLSLASVVSRMINISNQTCIFPAGFNRRLWENSGIIVFPRDFSDARMLSLFGIRETGRNFQASAIIVGSGGRVIGVSNVKRSLAVVEMHATTRR